MASPALQQLMDLQRSMYDRAIAEAREYSGGHTTSITSYEKEFEASLPNDFQSVAMRKIMEAIDRHPVTLFGDFHSHKQSQRAFLRAIRMYQNRPDHAPVVVCLEMFRSEDQAHVNAWLSGHISDQDLLESVNYDTTWGFPWNNYRPILEYCKYQSIPVIGINTAKGGKDTLAKRDAHAARVIQKLTKGNPGTRVLCLIGEFHLADGHLPNALNATKSTQNPVTPLRIFTNLDKYFFLLQPETVSRRDQYLELSPSTYCIINSPPWIKWHSQALWEEMRRIGSIKYLENSLAPDDVENDLAGWEDEDDDIYNDDVLDLDHHLRHLQKQILEFLRIPAPLELLDRFNITQGALDDELSHLPAGARNAFLMRASTDGFAVDYENRLVYMPEISINNMAAAAGQMLFGALSGAAESPGDPDWHFTTQCLKYTFGFIANKILNPRLPLQNIKNVEDYAQSTRGKRLIGQMRQRRSVAMATVKLHDWILEHWRKKTRSKSSLPKIPAPFTRLDNATCHDLCVSLAQTIADPICGGLVKGKLDTQDLRGMIAIKGGNIKAAKESLAAMITLNNT